MEIYKQQKNDCLARVSEIEREERERREGGRREREREER